MGSVLASHEVRIVLEKLRSRGEAEDAVAKERVRAREHELGMRLYGRERAELCASAPLSIAPSVGELLHVLASACRARTIIEFGASFGVSTIYLAAALRDLDGSLLITTELVPEKGQLARQNLAQAGLADLVEVRVGDALETLRDLPADVDLLFLDGANDLYLSVLHLVEPRLRNGAIVAADLSRDDPHLLAYCWPIASTSTIVAMATSLSTSRSMTASSSRRGRLRSCASCSLSSLAATHMALL